MIWIWFNIFFKKIFLSACRSLEYLNKNCSICELKCLKLGIGYIENSCVYQPTQNLTKCYCCKIITEDVCLLFKEQPCSECKDPVSKKK